MKNLYNKYINTIIDEILFIFNKIKITILNSSIIEITPSNNNYDVIEIRKNINVTIIGVVNNVNNELVMHDSIKNKLNNSIVNIKVKNEWVFEIILDSLPYESETVIPGIIKHQIERKTPFRYSDIIYSFTKKINKDNTIFIVIYVIPKSLIKPIINIVLNQSPEKLYLVINHDDNKKSRINIDTIDNKHQHLIRKKLYIIINILIFIIISILSYESIDISLINNQISDTEEYIENDKNIIKEKTEFMLKSINTNDIVNIKETSAPIVMVIEMISKFLPDDAYLLELNINNNVIKMIGISHNVENIIPSFEKSSFFIKTKFISPIVRLSDNQGDKFNIETIINKSEMH